MINPGQASSWGNAGLEPSLDELLSDQAATTLMRADRVTVEDVRRAVSNARRRLEARRTRATPLGVRSDAAPKGKDRALIPALLDDATFAEHGLRHDQVVRLRTIGATEAAELDRMLVRIGLGMEALPSPVRIDLRLTCAGCSERPQCRRWLATDEADDGYRRFCPNAAMFDRMRQVQRWRDAPLHPTGDPAGDASIDSQSARP